MLDAARFVWTESSMEVEESAPSSDFAAQRLEAEIQQVEAETENHGAEPRVKRAGHPKKRPRR